MEIEHSSTGPPPRTNRGWVYEDRIEVADDGCRALDFYTRRYRHSTRAEWQARLAAGQIERDGAALAPETRLRAGDRLRYHRPPWAEPPAPRTFAVLHEAAGVLAVAKPSGLQVLPAARFLENTLLHVVREKRGARWSPAHRLGRGTSGLVLFTGDAPAGRALAAAFRDGGVRKLYRALVQGTGLPPAFEVTAPIGRVDHGPTGFVWAAAAPGQGGRPSRSRVRVLEARGAAGASLVEVEIPTGRPHQIRIHLAAAGHPLLDEPLYGPGGRPRADAPEARPGDTGYHLHAERFEWEAAPGGALRLYCRPPPALRASGES